MANELKIRITFEYTDPTTGLTHSTPKDWVQFMVDVAGDAFMDNVQTVGTSEEVILLGDIAYGGWVFAKNLDATNYVDIREAAEAVGFIRLLPGEVCAFRLAADAASAVAIANSASCKVRFIRIAL